MAEISAFDPLNRKSLAESIERRFLEQEPHRLSNCSHIVGAGVYALYFAGETDLYAPLSQAHKAMAFSLPIYVGKAIPKGGRKGGLTKDVSKGKALADRLKKHLESIRQVSAVSPPVGPLKSEDFWFRSLVVEDIWIPLGENMLIETFRPVWNLALDGFGNNPLGKGRETQKRSPWDTLHPGRKGAEKGISHPSPVSKFLAHQEIEWVNPMGNAA